MASGAPVPRLCGAFAPARPALRPPLAVWARLGLRHHPKRAHHGAIDDVGAQNSPVISTVQSQIILASGNVTASMRTVA